MRAQLTNRDYEQLSAYIDGQLAPAERRKLEERLRVHSDLQAVLDEMSRTRALLRSAPRRRAPRNFTLTPAMVGSQMPKRGASWWNLFPVLSFTSAVATLALVASIVFQLLPGQRTVATTAMQPQADQVAVIVQQTMAAMQATAPAGEAPAAAAPAGAAPLEGGRNLAAPEDQTASPEAQKQAVPAANQTLPQATATAPMVMESTTVPEQPLPESTSQGNPPIVAWGGNPANATGFGMGGGGDGQSSSGSLLGPPSTAGAVVAMGKGGGGGGEQPVLGQNIVIPQESVNPQDTTTLSQPEVSPNEPAPAQANPAISGPGPILGIPSQGDGGQIVEKRAILGQPEAGPNDNYQSVQSQPGAIPNQPGETSTKREPQTLFGLPGFILIQVLLALIAIATGAAAFIIRKRAR